MKKIIGIGVGMLLLPWIITLFWTRDMKGALESSAETQSVSTTQEIEVAATDVPESMTKERRILVKREDTNTYISLEDYLPGVMICQIPPEYEEEVLKCQAIIVRTYIERLMDGRTEIWEEELDLDYLQDNQGGIPWDKETMSNHLERFKRAVDDTKGQVMEWENRKILPLFHQINGGRTRQGEADYPYLQTVESGWDVNAQDYLKTMEFTYPQFVEKINQIPDGTPIRVDQLPNQIQTVKKDDSGYILEIKVGEKTYKGEEVQYALGLPSLCFSIEGGGEKIKIVIRGKGHGYGLSQAGAQGMALDGWTYEDILNYYYKNISINSA